MRARTVTTLARPAPHAAPAPPPALEARYVDEARTHHVLARPVAEGDGLAFEVVELPGGPHAPEDAVRTLARMTDAWEARFHLADLEARLAQLGRYWRRARGEAGWVPLRAGPGAPRIDLRAAELPSEDARVAFHHFHRHRERAHLLLTLPRPTPLGPRYLVADLGFETPRASHGALRILHERAPAGPLRSLLAREHVELARSGFEAVRKAREFALAYGSGWRAMLEQAIASALDRIARRDEAPAPDADEPRAPDADVHRALLDPRLAALHRRFLTDADECALRSGNAADVRRLIARRRERARHDEQHLLTLLEASLLARACVRAGARIDPAAARPLRRLEHFL